MADESPEQIRERVHAEELAKGSDPRVAEGRAKAAELRARQGLPIEPDAAWRKKLEMEGGPAGPAVAEAPPSGPAEAPPSGPAEAAEPEAPAQVEPVPETRREPEPAEASPDAAPETREPAPAAAMTADVPPGAAVDQEEITLERAPMEPARPEPREAAFEPEIGQRVELDAEAFDEIAGIKLQDSVLPKWLLVVLLVISLAAAAYVVVFAGAEDFGTGCRVEPDRTLVCFIAD